MVSLPSIRRKRHVESGREQRVALVTGAASGIGAALVARLLSDGFRVCATDVQALESLVERHGAERLLIAALDVRDPAAWHAVVAKVQQRWQRLDVLANVAGVLRDGWVHETTPDDVDFHFDINVKGSILGMQAVLPAMRKAGKGNILNVASLASLSPVPGLGLYSASKYAIRAYSLAAAMELAPEGIAVTTICPDAVATPMLDIQKGKPQAELTFSGPRALTPREVADAMVDQGIRDRQMEVILPPWRGATAKLVNVFPQTGKNALGLFRRTGKKRQAAYKSE